MAGTQSVVCLLAREAGLACLKNLQSNPSLRILALATHTYLPRSEAATQVERVEWAQFQHLALQHHIPFFSINSKVESLLPQFTALPAWDYLISCSWRYHVPRSILSKTRVANINLHRGKLPTYAGAEPVKRALQNGDKQITVTAHEMTDVIDAGAVLAEENHPVRNVPGESPEQTVERIKKELLPLYPEALRKALSHKGDKKLV